METRARSILCLFEKLGKDVAPIYQMTTAVGRRPAGDTRRVDFCFANFRPTRFVRAHGRQR